MKVVNTVSVGLAVAAGVITLALLLVPFTAGLLTVNNQSGLTIVLGWVSMLSAVALLVGILNLFAVHFRKASALNLNSIYSFVFILAFIAVMFMWALGSLAKNIMPAGAARDTLVLFGDGTRDFAFKYIQSPVEASLSAVLAVVLVLAGARLILTRRHWSALIFVGVALLLLIGLAPIFNLTALSLVAGVITTYVTAGAARGILLGVALGVIATGLRVIFGLDQPYGE